MSMTLTGTSSPGRAAPAPWRVGDVVTLGLCSVVGWSLVVAAWFGASGSASVSVQIAWLNAGVAGGLVLSLGSVWWLLCGRRVVAARRSDQLVRLAQFDALSRPTDQDDAPDVLAASPLDLGETLVATGFRHYHRPDCPLVRGKPSWPASLPDHVGADRTACGVCSP